MKLAFIILAHKNPEQLQMLVDKLLENGSQVYVHIDKKSKRGFEEFMRRSAGRPSLFLYSRYRVYWGSYNQIRATLFLLKQACRKGGFDFVSLISGQDLPVKPLDRLKEFLSKHRNSSFLSSVPLPAHGHWAGRGGLDRVELFWITHFPRFTAPFFNRLNVILHRFQNYFGLRRKVDLPLFGGANWFTLNAEMACYVIDFLQGDPSFLRQFRNTRLADEVVMQTILMNSPHAPHIHNHSLSFTDWRTGPEYPRTFTREDAERLEDVREFFARKFDEEKDREVITYFLSRA